MIAKFRKFKKRSSPQNIFFSVLFSVLLLSAVGFLIITNLQINQKRAELISRIKTLEREIQIAEERNEVLKGKISQAGTKDYLEKVAREQLDLKASGEEVVVIAKEKEEKKEVEEEKKSWWEQIKSIFSP